MTHTDAALGRVDPAAIPQIQMVTGARMPGIGLGTFGSDNYSAAQVADAVRGAAAAGYRHFDCAAVYGNEREAGDALQDVLANGVGREELWITSKVWNDRHGDGEVIASCRQSLQDLKLEYLDLFLVHWPFPNSHGKGVDAHARDPRYDSRFGTWGCCVDAHARDPHARPYVHSEYMRVWRQMEQLVEMGLVKHIGTSNMTIPKLTLLLRDAKIKPAANEMELHPHFQQPELFDFVRENGMVPIGYSPIGSPSRPERDRTADDTVDIEDPIIVEIARQHGVHPAVVCLLWAVQRGQVPIPFSVKPSQYIAALQAAANDRLTENEMAAIAGIDKNNRLIKGHVFLWRDGQTWEDLWDVNGEIVQ